MNLIADLLFIAFSSFVEAVFTAPITFLTDLLVGIATTLLT